MGPPSVTKSDPQTASTSGADVTSPIVTPGGTEKRGVQIREPPVSDTRGYTVVKIEEKHGPLFQAIPVMPLPLAVLFCVLNILLPGVGTLFSSFAVFCCGPTRITPRCRAFGLNLASALLQMLTFLLIVGWVWSIRWGITFVELSLSTRGTYKNVEANPYYVRRQSSVDYEKQTSRHSQA